MTSLRILLVEDDELNQALVRAVLARSTYRLLRGCDVVTAGNLARARAVLADGGVDVVLLDMHLPDGSGLVLAAELQQAAAARQPAGAERAAVPHQVAARQPAGVGQAERRGLRTARRGARRGLRGGAEQAVQLGRAVRVDCG